MHSLSQRVGETLNLAVLDRSYVVMVGRKAGRLPIPVTANYAGSRPAAHATAAGKLLLAFSSAQIVEEVLARDGMPGYTLDTIDDRDALFRELDQVRADGVARDRGELEPEIECLASPIHDPLGNVAGVLALSATRERFARDALEYTAALRSATHEISERWLRV
jgi:DNA-binding IclR family transcriptional regulator